MTTRAFGELTFEADKGVHISDAALTVARIADQTGRIVVLTFNQVAVRVEPGTRWGEVFDRYTAQRATRDFSA